MVPGMLALLSLTTAMVSPTGPDKAAQRYRVNVELKQEVDLTAAGAGPQEAVVNGTVFFTLTMSDTTGGKLAHVVIDSMTVSATGQLAAQFTQDAANALRGATLHGYVVDGKLSGPAKPSVEDNPAMNIAMAGMPALFPGITSKANAGQGWVDTTRSETSSEAGTQNTEQIVTWTVSGREGATLTLTSSGTGTFSAESNGQQITGTVTSTGSVTSVIGGPATSSTLNTTQNLSVLSPSLPDAIPVKVSSQAVLTQLP